MKICSSLLISASVGILSLVGLFSERGKAFLFSTFRWQVDC